MLHSIGLGNPSRKYCSIEVGSRISKSETLEFCERSDFPLGNMTWEIRVSKPNGTQHKINGASLEISLSSSRIACRHIVLATWLTFSVSQRCSSSPQTCGHQTAQTSTQWTTRSVMWCKSECTRWRSETWTIWSDVWCHWASSPSTSWNQ